MAIRSNTRDRRTVAGDWFGSEEFLGLDTEHLQSFPNGHYYRALFAIALQITAEDLLNQEEN